MPSPLRGRKVAFLATDGVEQVELTEPWNALKQAGADVVLVSEKPGEIQAVNHDSKGEKFHVDVEVSKAGARDFDALVLPGGVANPDKLRMNKDAVNFVREFMVLDKPVAAICHGPWLQVLADAIDERRLDKMVEQSFPASDPLPGPIALG
jgi:protease I